MQASVLSATAAPGVKFRLVYLERDPLVATSFIRAFGKRVFIVPFENPEAVLGWLQAGNEADLVVVNEGMGGFQLLKALRNKSFLPPPPVILTTAHLGPEIRDQALQLRALDVFSTDEEEENFRHRLDYLIRKKAYFSAHPRWAEVEMPRVRIPFWKRALDVSVSLSLLTALSPVMLVAGVLIYLDSPGTVFYSSKRVGAGYRVFSMYKFRSMRLNADTMLAGMASKNLYASTASETDASARCEACQLANIPCQRPLHLEDTPICEQEYLRAKKAKAMFMKFREDPRVTRLGRILRNTSIDELPQLYNILRGDMSLVGNRPLPQYEAEKLTTTAYVQRFSAPAGLTGLWQVMKRAKGQGVMSDQERIQLDIQYAETFSFRTDLDIMIKTLTAVWQKENV